MWSSRMNLNFTTLSTILKYYCKETGFEGRERCQPELYVQYNVHYCRTRWGSTSVSRTMTTWRALRMQMERTASTYERYLKVHWTSRRGCRQGVALDQRLGREPVTDINESCYETTGLGRALWSCLIKGMQTWDLELGMSGSVAYELYYQGY